MMIIARELTKVYQRGQEKISALRGVNLEIEPGSFAFIVGPSGGGKSTLLHLLGGMDQPTSGQLSVNGIPLEKASEDSLTGFRRKHIGFVFQFYNLISSLDALENVSLPLLANGSRMADAHKQAAAMLERVGLAARIHHRPSELSGGEQQRVAVARAVIAHPSLVMADEPTGDLDLNNAQSVMQLMFELNRSLGITFMIATHNEALTSMSDRIFELHDGLLKER